MTEKPQVLLLLKLICRILTHQLLEFCPKFLWLDEYFRQKAFEIESFAMKMEPWKI